MSETTQSADTTEKVKRNYGPEVPPKVKVSEVLAMLESGKDRKDIAAHYGLNANQTKDLFNHPKLKGKKTKKDYSSAYVLEDDTDETVPVYVAPVKKTDAPQASSNGQAKVASNDGTGAALEAGTQLQSVAEDKGAWD